MIEIGNERTFQSVARRIAPASGNIAILLLLVWLVRGILSLSAYSGELLVASFALIFLKGILSTRTSLGMRRAVPSFTWNIATRSVIVLLLIWFLGWIASIQVDVLPTSITQQVPNLAILAIGAGLGAYVAYELMPRTGSPVVSGPAILVGPSSSVDFGEVKLSTRKDSIVLPIRGTRRTLGAMVLGDVNATFETPMGIVTGSIPGPVTTMGIPFRGRKANNADVSGVTGKPLPLLMEETHVDTTPPRGEIFATGFRGNSFGEGRLEGESVDVGPISVRLRRAEEDVEVGPFSFNPCDWSENPWDQGPWFRSDRRERRDPKRSFKSPWLAKDGRGSSYLSATVDGVQARWNSSSIRLKGDSMKMAVGSDGFVYSPVELETYSPLHTLHVTKSKAVLNTAKFALNVSGSKVVLRAQGGSKITESAGLAGDLLELLTEMAKKHVRAVMDGEPMELDDMLAGTEEVLKKYE